MDINIAKGIVLVAVFTLTFVFSILPLLLIKRLNRAIDHTENTRYARIISLLSCFAGGVFMATGLLDLFPEVTSLFQMSSMPEMQTSFPLAEFAVATGFFIVLIMEQIVLDYKERSVNYDPPQEESTEIRRGSIEGIRDDQSSLTSENEPISSARSTQIRRGSIEGTRDDQSSVTSENEPISSARSVMLVAALSIHSLFEGIAIGLQPNVQDLLQIFTAVILHKVIIAFSLGLNLVQTKMKIRTIAQYSALFCVTTPLGIGIAMSLEEFGHAAGSSVTNGILQGLACGTFFYVTFFEVLPHELNQEGNRLLKVLLVITGYAFVTVTLLLEAYYEQRKGVHGTRNMFNKYAYLYK